MRKLLGLAIMLIVVLSSFELALSINGQNGSREVYSRGNIQYGSTVPYLRGWGSSRIQESDRYHNAWLDGERNGPTSEVFPGQVASDLEMTVKLLVQRGYNAIRLASGYPEWSESYTSGIPGADPEWMWNDTYFLKALNICKHYGIWMIATYGGSDFDPENHTEQWLSFWQNVIREYGHEYENIIWEPCNEPQTRLEGQAAVDNIGQLYQRWINMCRNASDTHWLVVSIVCFWNSLPEEDWWGHVTDPANRTLLNRHHYYFYSPECTWTLPAALAAADHAFQVDKTAITKYGRPFLCTEFGATTGWNNAPDQVYTNGYTGFSNISFAFVQRLMDNYESENMSYILFPCSDVYPPRLYGDLNVWGQLLSHVSPERRPIFSDDFEWGDLTAWSGTAGYPTLQSSIAYNGTQALRCDTASTEKVQKQFVAQPKVFTRTYVYFSNLPSVNNVFSFLAHYEHISGVNNVVVGVQNVGGATRWYVTFPPFWGSSIAYATSGPSAGAWYCVELETSLSGNVTDWRLWVNGASILSGNYSGSSHPYDAVYLGSWDKNENLTNYLDCVVIDDSYIGPY